MGDRHFGLRERGKRKDFTLLGGGEPIGGNSNPGASLADIKDMYYINKNEIPPENHLHVLDSIRFLRKSKKKKSKIKRNKKCGCK